jgi:hypothetical protein
LTSSPDPFSCQEKGRIILKKTREAEASLSFMNLFQAPLTFGVYSMLGNIMVVVQSQRKSKSRRFSIASITASLILAVSLAFFSRYDTVVSFAGNAISPFRENLYSFMFIIAIIGPVMGFPLWIAGIALAHKKEELITATLAIIFNSAALIFILIVASKWHY